MKRNEQGQKQLLQPGSCALFEQQESRAWALKWDAQGLAELSKKQGPRKNGTDVNREDSLSAYR